MNNNKSLKADINNEDKLTITPKDIMWTMLNFFEVNYDEFKNTAKENSEEWISEIRRNFNLLSYDANEQEVYLKDQLQKTSIYLSGQDQGKFVNYLEGGKEALQKEKEELHQISHHEYYLKYWKKAYHITGDPNFIKEQMPLGLSMQKVKENKKILIDSWTHKMVYNFLSDFYFSFKCKGDDQTVKQIAAKNNDEIEKAFTFPDPPRNYQKLKIDLTDEQLRTFFSFLYLENNSTGHPFLSKEDVLEITRYGLAIPNTPPKKQFKLDLNEVTKPKGIIYYSFYQLFFRFQMSKHLKEGIALFLKYYFVNFKEIDKTILKKSMINKKPAKMHFDIEKYLS